MKIRIEKERYQTVSDFGHSSHTFYGYLILDGKRKGTVWKDKIDKRYIFNEDFDRRANRRSYQVVAPTIAELKNGIQALY